MTTLRSRRDAQQEPISTRPRVVLDWQRRLHHWGCYATLYEAAGACLAPRKFGFDARVDAIEVTP